VSHNKTTGVKVITPSDWDLVPSADWNKDPSAAPGPARPRSMLIKSFEPYIDILEEPSHNRGGGSVHKHTEDEILVVLQGEMMINGEIVGTGSIAFIPANEEYWHSTTDQRCVIGVIRPSDRGYLVRNSEVKQGTLEKSEQPSEEQVPYRTSLTAGQRYLWCACGKSTSQPFCDGKSHIGTSRKPQPGRAEVDRIVVFCGCKRTCNPPYCDGSHLHGEPLKA